MALEEAISGTTIELAHSCALESNVCIKQSLRIVGIELFDLVMWGCTLLVRTSGAVLA